MGVNMKSSWGTLMVMLLVAISLSGCVYIENVFQPAPTPEPIVTIMPTPMPTATPVPTPVVRQMSTDVKIMPVGDKGIYNFDFEKGTDEQKEIFNVVVINDGSTDAKNVILSLSITDAFGGNSLKQQKFSVGDLKSGDLKECFIKTDGHYLANSVHIIINIEWGENGEYTNPVTYGNIDKTIWR
jgi:hypothetical protein